MRRATSRTVLASEPPLRASARCRGVPLGQRRVADSPCGSSCVTSRDASDRLLPSHVYVRVPAPRRFPLRQPLSRLRNRRDRLFHGSAIRFGGPHVLPGDHRAGLVVPAAMRAFRTSGIPVASPSWCRPARTEQAPEGGAETVYQLTRVNGASRADDPRCLPSCKGPSPRDALSSARLRTSRATRLGHRVPGSRRLFTPRSALASSPVGRAPVHAPRCQRVSRFLESRRRLPTSAT
jgi:hypothetical protein